MSLSARVQLVALAVLMKDLPTVMILGGEFIRR